ncbi:hypothetical protein M2S00_07305 [Apilactobacillus sp. TMW 2.2459]|uniref:hypothetical protein n=1 Tax=Apilactobacillus xinyiensis TaxID=2841032 RepID=UPI00201065EF|nr:hypothetical protein [Apilactobacillus xinyiensis]MCL0312913.1 hypothetical protein [Apilactobacillus xinyiensis]
MKNSLITFKNESNKATPLISADVMAKMANIQHKSINQTIRNNTRDLGKVLFEKEVNKKIYYLNEYQALRLLEFLRTTKNTKQARISLINVIVDQFKKANSLQVRRQTLYEIGKPLSNDLSNAIKDNPYSNSFSYTNYNNLIYKIALKTTPKELRSSRHIPKSKSITECLSVEEYKAVENIKHRVTNLIELNLSYKEVRDIMKRGIQRVISIKTKSIA